MQEFFKRVVESMDDQELEDFLRAGWSERRNRIMAKLERGEFPSPTQVEMFYHTSGNMFLAVKSYRDRTGVDLLAAKAVLDKATELPAIQPS